MHRTPILFQSDQDQRAIRWPPAHAVDPVIRSAVRKADRRWRRNDLCEPDNRIKIKIKIKIKIRNDCSGAKPVNGYGKRATARIFQQGTVANANADRGGPISCSPGFAER